MIRPLVEYLGHFGAGEGAVTRYIKPTNIDTMTAMLPELQSNEFSERKILLAFIRCSSDGSKKPRHQHHE